MNPIDLEHAGTFTLRIGLALLAGMALGYEREGSGKAAGLKTTMLVCLASCSAMLLSIALNADAATASERGDPSRLAAGVLNGMGFLGAGVIMRQGVSIHGVTTAAVLWLTGIIGLVIGSGNYLLGSLSTCLALAALYLLPVIERRIRNERIATLAVEGSAELTFEELQTALKGLDVLISKTAIERNIPAATVRYELDVLFKHETGAEFPEDVARMLAELPHARQVAWR